MAMHRETRVLHPPAPYMMTLHLEKFSLPGRPVPYVYEKGSMRRLIRLHRGYAAAHMVFTGEPWRPSIAVTLYTWEPGLAAEALEAVARCLRVDFDYNEFVARLEAYPVLRRLAEKYPGLRPGRSLSIYEALIDVVVKQRIALRMALAITARLIEKYGARMIVEGTAFYGYPEPGVLASVDPEELRRLGLTRMKARALVEIARAEEEGRLPGLREVEEDPHGVAEELTRLYGIGRWSAELAVAMASPRFALGPFDDLAVRRGLAIVYGRPVSREEAMALLRDLGDYMGLVLYLAALVYEEGKRRR